MTRPQHSDKARALRNPGVTRVYLHVGAPKTGTTYLQDVLWQNRKALAADGVLYPGNRASAHFHASLDLRGARFHGYDDPAVPGAWEEAAAAARRWTGGAVVISHETLAWAREEHVRRAVASLQPAEVHVLYTARDLARQIPAVWQESVKNRRLVGFPRFLQSLKAPERRGPWGKIFWGGQDAVEVLRRWNAGVPADRIHVITVPPRGATPGLLWERFASVIGIDPARFDTDTRKSNISLGSVEAELLRRINRSVGEDIDWPAYARLFKHGLAESVLANRSDARRITLPPQWHPWARERSQQLVEGLRAAKYDVVGDLDELIPRERVPRDEHESGPAGRPSADAVLDVAAETIVQLVRERPVRTGARPGGWRALAGAGWRRVRRITGAPRARR